ncbi:MAG: GMC family oxidoreductase [Acidimicrobiales bacterium]|nr:GMC family oxidoreductase [Acidimicrobiales bacterium]
MGEYDVVIVGGGSAGLVLATRLSADPARSVLLIEAGPDVPKPGTDDRLADQMTFATTLTHWGIDASFVPGGTLNYPQGRKLGGGSSVNGAFAVRGIPDDYERWAAEAGPAWSWAEMLRVLKRLEADRDFADDHHGVDGPVPVVRWTEDELLPMQRSFRDAVMAHGIGWVDDMNAPDASGVGVIPMNRENGLRMSTALTYLPIARGRENLSIWTDCEAHRVLLDAGRAVGVEVGRNGGVTRVTGERIILAAGALQSPTLLLRSGIGPSAHLAEHGIGCAVDLPGVGENLMDHQGTAVFLVPKGELRHPPDARMCQVGARYSSSSGLAVDDMWLSMWSVWPLADFPDFQTALGVPAISSLIAGVHDPASRGTVRLRSADPSVRPAVDFNMLSHPDDRSRMVEGLQLAMDLATSAAFASDYRGIGLLDMAARNDRSVLEGYLESTVGGWYHASGTCRMGTDPHEGAVVGGDLRVHGVDGLCIADASIMPTVVRAPTNLTSIAIGERAAELLA